MSITVTLVENTPYRLRYVVNASPTSPTASPTLHATIPNDGGATPDLLTDAANYPLRAVMQARTAGFFSIAPGALSLAECRAILNSDDPTHATLTNNNVPRCVLTVTPRSGNTQWAVDASPDAQGDPIVVVRSTRSPGVTGSAVAYVDIELRHSYDL